MSARPILLDTHVALWLPQGEALAASAEEELQRAQREGPAVFVSPITAWEIGMLVARGRVALPSPPIVWLDSLVNAGMRWAPLPPGVLIDSSFLPGQLHGDPADRILAATARTYDFRLMTRDRRLLDYARAGHLRAIPC